MNGIITVEEILSTRLLIVSKYEVVFSLGVRLPVFISVALTLFVLLRFAQKHLRLRLQSIFSGF